MITVERITDIDTIGKQQWNAVLQESETDVVFLTYEWISCWWKTLRKHNELFLLAVRDGDMLVGIAPFMLTKRAIGPLRYKVLEIVGTGESDYCDIIAAEGSKLEVLTKILEYLSSNRTAWDLLSLLQIPGSSSTTKHLETLAKRYDFLPRSFVKTVCPALLIAEDPEFALSCAKKKSVKRHYNHFDKSGTLVCKTAKTIGEIEAELDDFFQQHIERRAIANSPSKFLDQSARLFYQCLARELLQTGWLKFAIVTFNQVPIAYHFGFQYQSKFIWYKPTFNVDYLKKSPGEVLIKFLLEQAIAAELLEFDFTIGDEAFKRRFSNVVRENMQIDISCNRLVWIALVASDTAKRLGKATMPRAYIWLKSMMRPEYANDDPARNDAASRSSGSFSVSLKYFLSRVATFALETKSVGVFKTDNLKLPSASISDDFNVRQGQLSDFRYFVHGQPELQRRKLLLDWHSRLKRGQELFVAYADGTPVHYQWVWINRHGPCDGANTTSKDGNLSARLLQFFTIPSYRKMGYFRRTVYSLYDYLGRTTPETLEVYCDKGNVDAANALNAIGFARSSICTRIYSLGRAVFTLKGKCDEDIWDALYPSISSD